MRKKRFLALLLLFCLLFASVSCKHTGTVQSANIRLLASDLSEYTLIISEKPSAGEREEINAFVKAVQKKFGVLLKVKDSTYTEPTEKEILIGETNRSQTEEARKLLRYGETYVGAVNGKLVILGATSADTVKAIRFFSELLAGRAGEDVLFDSEKELYHEKAVFAAPDLSLNGVSMTEYTILFAGADSKREKRFAELIADVILKRSGIIVPVQSDSEEAYGNILLVGRSSAEIFAGQAGLSADNDVVILLGNTENDLFYATQTLIGRIEKSTGNVEVGAFELLSYTTSDLDLSAYGLTPDRITIMSYNVQNAGGASDPPSKYENLSTMIGFKNPDFICMQECVAGSGAADKIQKALTNRNSYAAIRSDTDAATSTAANAILYNKTKYTLLSAETILLRKALAGETDNWDRYFTWAKMKSNATGAIFVVISVHVDYVPDDANAEFSRMLAYVEENFADLPVLIAGDYNLYKPQPMFDYLEAQGFEDAGETSYRTKNGSEATFPKEGRERTIDFIYESGFTADYYEVMMQKINPSDHRPIYVECFIDLNH